MALFTWLLGGFIIGAIAQFLVKGHHGLGCVGTIGLGMLGSLVGGTTLNAIGGNGFDLAGSNFLGSIFGAVLVLVVARLIRKPPPQRF